MEFAFTEHKDTIDQFLNQYSFLSDLDQSAQKICVLTWACGEYLPARWQMED